MIDFTEILNGSGRGDYQEQGKFMTEDGIYKAGKFNSILNLASTGHGNPEVHCKNKNNENIETMLRDEALDMEDTFSEGSGRKKSHLYGSGEDYSGQWIYIAAILPEGGTRDVVNNVHVNLTMNPGHANPAINTGGNGKATDSICRIIENHPAVEKPAVPESGSGGRPGTVNPAGTANNANTPENPGIIDIIGTEPLTGECVAGLHGTHTENTYENSGGVAGAEVPVDGLYQQNGPENKLKGNNDSITSKIDTALEGLPYSKFMVPEGDNRVKDYNAGDGNVINGQEISGKIIRIVDVHAGIKENVEAGNTENVKSNSYPGCMTDMVSGKTGAHVFDGRKAMTSEDNISFDVENSYVKTGERKTGQVNKAVPAGRENAGIDMNPVRGVIRPDQGNMDIKATGIAFQISRKITSVEGDAIKEIELKLEPESLGTIKIRVASLDDKVDVSIKTCSAGTRQLISESINVLKNNLAAKGMEIGELTVSVDPNGPGGDKDSSGGLLWQQQDTINGNRNVYGGAAELNPEVAEVVAGNFNNPAAACGHLNIII
ncbi:MAG: flagellar hook-length control protein FliK [Actinobacteria bacterium]|nr:flagellar hook-length control protein FliK [Actinomycetota bacterium]